MTSSCEGPAAGVDLRQILLDLLLHSRPDRILIDLKAVTAVDGLVIGALRAACEIAQDVHLLLAAAVRDRLVGPRLGSVIREHGHLDLRRIGEPVVVGDRVGERVLAREAWVGRVVAQPGLERRVVADDGSVFAPR